MQNLVDMGIHSDLNFNSKSLENKTLSCETFEEKIEEIDKELKKFDSDTTC